MHNDDDDESSPQLGHDESNWLVSYADMMTLLFGFFVLMYSMSRVDQDKFQVVSKDVAKFFGGKVQEDAGIKIATEDLKKHLGILMKQLQATPTKPLTENDNSLIVGGLHNVDEANPTEYAETEKAAEVDVQSGVNSLTLKFRGSILFQPGSAQIKPEFEKVLNELGQRLKASNRVKLIKVEGHTDDQPIRSLIFPTNWELSSARASRVVRQLIANGFQDNLLIAEGFSSSKPEAPNRDAKGQPIKENMSLNRRVVVHVEFSPPTAKDVKPDENYFEKVKKSQQSAAARVNDTGAVGDASSASEVEARIAEAKARLELAKQKLKEKQEAERKEKKLAELQKKLEDLNKKTSELTDKTKANERVPAKARDSK